MNAERKKDGASKEASCMFTQWRCVFPTNVPTELGHVRFTQWIWKRCAFKITSSLTCKKFDKKLHVLLPPTTHLWGSHACKNLFLLTCHIWDFLTPSHRQVAENSAELKMQDTQSSNTLFIISRKFNTHREMVEMTGILHLTSEYWHQGQLLYRQTHQFPPTLMQKEPPLS